MLKVFYVNFKDLINKGFNSPEMKKTIDGLKINKRIFINSP